MCGKDSQTCLPFNCLMTYVRVLKFHTHILQHVGLYNTITAADSFYISGYTRLSLVHCHQPNAPVLFVAAQHHDSAR